MLIASYTSSDCSTFKLRNNMNYGDITDITDYGYYRIWCGQDEYDVDIVRECYKVDYEIDNNVLKRVIYVGSSEYDLECKIVSCVNVVDNGLAQIEEDIYDLLGGFYIDEDVKDGKVFGYFERNISLKELLGDDWEEMVDLDYLD